MDKEIINNSNADGNCHGERLQGGLVFFPSCLQLIKLKQNSECPQIWKVLPWRLYITFVCVLPTVCPAAGAGAVQHNLCSLRSSSSYVMIKVYWLHQAMSLVQISIVILKVNIWVVRHLLFLHIFRKPTRNLVVQNAQNLWKQNPTFKMSSLV